MSRDGSGPTNDPDEAAGNDDEVATEEDWPPFEQEDPDEQAGWNLEERQEELERKEDILRSKEEELREQERELNKRQREIEKREQEVLDRREEIVDERDRIEQKEEQLTQKEQELDEKASKIDGREQEIQSLKDDIEAKIESMGQTGSTQMFTNRPRKAGGVLLGLLGVVGILVGLTLVLATSAWPAVFARPLTSATSITLGNVVAVALIVLSLIEIVGGFFAYRGSMWFLSIVAGIIAMALFFPVGLTATIFLTVGESQFS